MGSLAPDGFEELCVRLVNLEPGVIDARRYGVSGQAQHGIDVLAERAGSGFQGPVVVQCKRSNDDFTAREITAAVGKFLEGKWAQEGTEFILAVTAPLQTSQKVDRLAKERARLRERGITLAVWDQIALSRKLKDHPALVGDFFGRECVRVFNGEDAARRLGRDEEGRRRELQAQLVEVRQWDADRLNVHPAVPGVSGTQPGQFVLPRYIGRPHDEALRERLRRLAAGSRNELLVIRGQSCTGKTRTAFEAVRAVLGDWCLAFPKTAGALLEMMDGARMPARTVLWLDDFHQLLQEPQGQAAAARLRRLLDDNGPVALIATMWTQEHHRFTALPGPGRSDAHYQARTLLRAAWLRDVPEEFDADSMANLHLAADSDASLREVRQAVEQSHNVAQTLAAGPDLVQHWMHASNPYGKAVITAAIDARRTGVRSPMPASLLQDAAPGYLSHAERAAATPQWFTEALDYAQAPIKGVTTVLTPVAHPTGMGALPGVWDLADYLQQHGLQQRWDVMPPASFWRAARDLSSGPDLERLAMHAFSCGRLRLSRDLYARALDLGHTAAFEGLCFSYLETDRILMPQGRQQLVTAVDGIEDGGYSLWYLGSWLKDIAAESGAEADVLTLAVEMLGRAYDCGHVDAGADLADLCTEHGLDASALIDEVRCRQAPASPASPNAALARARRAAARIPAEAPPPAEILARLREHEGVEDLVVASVVQGWPGNRREAEKLLEYCRRPHLLAIAVQAATALAKLPDRQAKQTAEDLLCRLDDDGHSHAALTLAMRRWQAWWHDDRGAQELPDDIRVLLERAAADSSEARRLLGHNAQREGHLAQAEAFYRSALDAGYYTVLGELAALLHPDSPQEARHMTLHGLAEDGTASPEW